MKLLLIICLFFSAQLFSQSIDGSFPFESDPAKKYSLYIPSDYDPATPSDLMIGLHPFNTNRWDAQAWRDTLINFAETNNLILACPDGGLDGKIDDAIDTAFTSILLDSLDLWYNIHPSNKYIMGFSWGGRTTYTYGLNRTNEFAGYIVIGPAITLGEVSDLMPNAKTEAFYLINGSQDNLNTRYTPLLAALEANDACVNSQVLSGVGHTIDFANRNAILTEAFQWLKEIQCTSVGTEDISDRLTIYPNPASEYVIVEGVDLYNQQIALYDYSGKKLPTLVKDNKIYLPEDSHGQFILELKNDETFAIKKIVKL